MRMLMVGAGSVGQLYGYCLQQGGAKVDVFVRPKYAEESAAGFRIYDRKKGLQSGDQFIPDSVLTSPNELANINYDAIFLCIPSTGLTKKWIEEFAAPLGEDVFVVSLLPGLKDRQLIENYIEPDRVATGMITSVSYPAPMSNETAAEPGTAYWFPPMTPALFSGNSERLRPILKILQKGGMSTKISSDLPTRAAFGTATLMPVIAVLETVDWSFKALKDSKERRKFLGAVHEETLSLVEHLFATKRPLPTRVFSPGLWAGALVVAPKVTPFDLETYLQLHFTKVGAQTRLFLKTYIEQRAEYNLDSPAIESLLDQLT